MKLSKLLSLSRKAQAEVVAGIDTAQVPGRGLRRKLERMKGRKQDGFTLLELLVVVAILAAIAGTATIMLQDTDRKGMAAAHVAMMDELSKGIQTFRVLNQGVYPDNWDSLVSSSDGTTAGTLSELTILESALAGMVAPTTLTTDEVAALNAVGITQLRYVDETQQGGECAPASIASFVLSKTNDVTPQNIFRPAAANGCGNDPLTPQSISVAANSVMLWTGGNDRVNADAADRLIAVGAGPDSTLFNPSIIGALSNVPVYRHTAPGEYNRFIVLWNVSDPGGQATFQAIIDGAGDTKDEELGEVDNLRAT
ncbi:MAG TPA: type II secretion system protein [Thiobacillaceae bacterium]|nr:type II secretion system protein [Thiobacillaceae bacterium]HNU64166.1 type II secretion system protein [Thiobacillaceae bacterium]